MDLGSSIRRRRTSPSKRSKGKARAEGSKKRRPQRADGPEGKRPSRAWRRSMGPSFRELAKGAKQKFRSVAGAGATMARRAPRLPDRPLLMALAVVAAGLATGYVVSTSFFFRPPAPPPELQGVPDLRGSPLDVAMASLADSGLGVSRVDSVYHPGVAAGLVIGQNPLPGRTALPEAPLRVTVSLGADVRPVPDVTRLPGSRAAALLEASGFLVQVDTVESTAPAGRVIRIEPVPGTPTAIPGNVRLAVSLGPPTFPMPTLTGMSERAAVNLLSALGLVVSEMDYRYSLLNVNVVFGQYPDPKSEVEQGAEVRLVIGRQVRPAGGIFFQRPPVRGRTASTP